MPEAELDPTGGTSGEAIPEDAVGLDENQAPSDMSIRGALAIVGVVYVSCLVVAYWLGAPGAVRLLDWFWGVFDYSTERLKVLGGLLPLAVIYVAYRVYRADQWWKRAEWALEAATDGDYDRRTVGMRAITALSQSGMADKEDKRLFNKFTTAALDAGVARAEREMQDASKAQPGPLKQLYQAVRGTGRA